MKELRYLKSVIQKTIGKKMVFIGGPRQVGKTTLSLEFIKPSSPLNEAYLNWDRATDKSKIIKDQLPLHKKVLLFDEIHKYKNWRNLLKGLYDKYHENHHFIVTGSARLVFFRKGRSAFITRIFIFATR